MVGPQVQRSKIESLEVSVGDILLIIDCILSKPSCDECNKWQGDVDGDGRNSIKDVLLLQDCILEKPECVCPEL